MIRDGRDSHRYRTNQPRRQTMTEQPARIPSETITALADVLAVHGRVNPPGGKCFCGHEVPLGRRFTTHQVRAMLDSEPGRAMLAERERQDRAEALREAAGWIRSATEGVDQAGTATWSAHDRAIYALAIEEVEDALADRADRVGGAS